MRVREALSLVSGGFNYSLAWRRPAWLQAHADTPMALLGPLFSPRRSRSLPAELRRPSRAARATWAAETTWASWRPAMPPTLWAGRWAAAAAAGAAGASPGPRRWKRCTDAIHAARRHGEQRPEPAPAARRAHVHALPLPRHDVQVSDSVALAGAVDPVAALIMCTPGPVDLSVINGVQVVRDARLMTCDLQVGRGAGQGRAHVNKWEQPCGLCMHGRGALRSQGSHAARPHLERAHALRTAPAPGAPPAQELIREHAKASARVCASIGSPKLAAEE